MSTGVKAHVAGSCGCKAGWFEMFPRLCKVDRGCAAAWQVGFRWLSVDWFVPESSIYWFKVSFLRGISPEGLGKFRGLVGKCLGCCRLLMHGGTQTIRFWGVGCKAGWFSGDVRQPGRLVSGGYPGRRLEQSSIFCEV